MLAAEIRRIVGRRGSFWSALLLGLGAVVTMIIVRLNQSGDHTHAWDPEVTEDGVPTTLAEMRSKDFAHLIENLDGYLCELGSALIRGGMHTLGERYAGERLGL